MLAPWLKGWKCQSILITSWIAMKCFFHTKCEQDELLQAKPVSLLSLPINSLYSTEQLNSYQLIWSFWHITTVTKPHLSPECMPEARWSKWNTPQPRRSCRRGRLLQTRFDLRRTKPTQCFTVPNRGRVDNMTSKSPKRQRGEINWERWG